MNFRIGETRAGKTVVCHNYVSSWHKDGSRECRIIEKPRISYLGDLFASQGLPGRVMYFKLRSRTSEKAADLLGLLRDLLLEHFGPTRPIGMGGVILIKVSLILSPLRRIRPKIENVLCNPGSRNFEVSVSDTEI